MNKKKRIGIIALTAMLTLGNVGNVFAEGSDTPKDESGRLYAGNNTYISEDVLTVAFQTTPLSNGEEPSEAALRLVTTVNDLSYQKVGFVVEMSAQKNGETLQNTIVTETKTVYKKIKAAAGSNNPAYDKIPQAFCEESMYFATHTITGIKSEYFRNTYFTVTPYWVTEDGKRVYGITRSVMLGDAYDGIISVPVRLNSDVETAAGAVEVTYPTETMTYVGYYNSGAVYEEMDVDGTTSGIVKCVGNVEDIANNVKADGMYVSLRFQVTRDANTTSLPEAEISVSENMFCDKVENIVTVPVVQAKYYTFNEPAEE